MTFMKLNPAYQLVADYEPLVVVLVPIATALVQKY